MADIFKLPAIPSLQGLPAEVLRVLQPIKIRLEYARATVHRILNASYNTNYIGNSASSYDPVADATVPPTPSGVSYWYDTSLLYMSWLPSTATNYSHTEVWESSVGTPGSGSKVAEVSDNLYVSGSYTGAITYPNLFPDPLMEATDVWVAAGAGTVTQLGDGKITMETPVGGVSTLYAYIDDTTYPGFKTSFADGADLTVTFDVVVTKQNGLPVLNDYLKVASKNFTGPAQQLMATQSYEFTILNVDAFSALGAFRIQLGDITGITTPGETAIEVSNLVIVNNTPVIQPATYFYLKHVTLAGVTSAESTATLSPDFATASARVADATANEFTDWVVPEVAATKPLSGGVTGQIVYASDDATFYTHDGTGYSAAVDGARIVAGSLVGASWEANAINTSQLAANGITVSHGAIFDTGVVTSAKIADATIENAKIVDGEITGAIIDDLTIEEAHFADLDIIDAKFGTAAIKDGNVSTLFAYHMTGDVEIIGTDYWASLNGPAGTGCVEHQSYAHWAGLYCGGTGTSSSGVPCTHGSPAPGPYGSFASPTVTHANGARIIGIVTWQAAGYIAIRPRSLLCIADNGVIANILGYRGTTSSHTDGIIDFGVVAEGDNIFLRFSPCHWNLTGNQIYDIQITWIGVNEP